MAIDETDSLREGILEAKREIAMARSRGWDDIANDWAIIERKLISQLAEAIILREKC